MQRADRDEVLAAYLKLPAVKKATIQLASDVLGVPRKTLSVWLRDEGVVCAAKPKELNANGEAQLLRRVKELERECLRLTEAKLSEDIVRGEIIKLAAFDPTPPSWTIKQGSGQKSPGVPQLMLSDWHYGEVVDPLQVNGVNKFNLKIADARAHQIVERAILLLTQYMTPANYPGIVVCLGGDMVSGDIHDELTATNDAEIMPTVMHIVNTLIWCIETLADAFGWVLVNCVTGNHGRNTKKIRAKGRNHTSFDWLIYAILAKHFENDKRIKFNIATGSDLLFKVYDHGYCLTHGDQFYGGDGIIGHLGPVTRGRQKKLSRDVAVGHVWDTMIHGHYHTYRPGDSIIGNGSLVGYGEYAAAGNFGFELPRQALWITHPKYGITYHIPVYASTSDELKRVGHGADWTSWVEQK